MKRFVLISATVLGALVLAASGYQRGGSMGGPWNNPCGGQDRAAGSDTRQPCADQSPPLTRNPNFRHRVDHENNLKDATRLVELASELKKSIESDGDFSLSVESLKRADEAAKLAKKLRDRMKSGS
jgi:hypothetical protein